MRARRGEPTGVVHVTLSFASGMMPCESLCQIDSGWKQNTWQPFVSCALEYRSTHLSRMSSYTWNVCTLNGTSG